MTINELIIPSLKTLKNKTIKLSKNGWTKQGKILNVLPMDYSKYNLVFHDTESEIIDASFQFEIID